MSVKAFVLSYSGILLLQMSKAGYSFAKPYIRNQYHITSQTTAIMDALMFLGVGAGYSLRYLFLSHGHPIKKLCFNGLIMCFFYLCIPLIPMLHQKWSNNTKHLLYGFVFIYGFLQFMYQSVLRKEMQRYYTNDLDECMFSCWFTATHLGKILGLMYMSMTVTGLGMSWHAALFVLAVLLAGDLGVIYYFFVVKEVQMLREQGIEDPHLHGYLAAGEGITMREFYDYARVCAGRPEVKYYLLLACFYKALHQNFVSWLPTYLFHYGYKELAGQITLVFVIPIFVGSFLIGKMYEHSTDRAGLFFNASVFLASTAVMTVGGLVLLTSMQMNYVQFVMVVFAEGVVIGGFYNVLRSSQGVIDQFSARQKEMIWTLIQATGSLTAGLINVVIAAMMKIREDEQSKQVEDVIFIALQIVAIATLFFLAMWIVAIHFKLQRDQEEEVQGSSLEDE